MIDPSSATWAEIYTHLRKRIAELEERLAKHRLDAIDTEYARGRLAEAKELLSLPESGQPQPPLIAPSPYEDA